MRKIIIDARTQFAVLGMGKFGRGLAETLCENGHSVLCCDTDGRIVHDAAPFVTHAVQADASDKAVLEKLGIGNFDVAVIAFGEDFEAAAVTATILKELGVRHIIAKANGVRQKQILESIGVDEVVLPEREMGERVAYSLMTNNLMESIHRSDEYDIIEMKPLPHWINNTLEKLRLRQTESINIIAIIRGGEVMAVLDAKTVILENDEIILLKSRRG